MGNSRWSSDAYATYSTQNTVGRSTEQIFKNRSVPDELNPTKFTGKRESRDSVSNPQSNAIIIGCDITGSMSFIADNLVRQGIGTTFEEILKRAADHTQRMISDPHLMVLGLGDAEYDNGPIQATQFEADIRIAEQLQQIWIEHGGGGNDVESYDMAWYLAAVKTSIDCWEKRSRKGYLFTIGDECAPKILTKNQIIRFFGDGVQDDLPSKQALEAAQRTYHVYHLIVTEGSFARRALPQVKASWREMLGQNAILLPDYTKLAETIVSIIQLNEGENLNNIASSWDGTDRKSVV